MRTKTVELKGKTAAAAKERAAKAPTNMAQGELQQCQQKLWACQHQTPPVQQPKKNWKQAFHVLSCMEHREKALVVVVDRKYNELKAKNEAQHKASRRIGWSQKAKEMKEKKESSMQQNAAEAHWKDKSKALYANATEVQNKQAAKFTEAETRKYQVMEERLTKKSLKWKASFIHLSKKERKEKGLLSNESRRFDLTERKAKADAIGYSSMAHEESKTKADKIRQEARYKRLNIARAKNRHAWKATAEGVSKMENREKQLTGTMEGKYKQQKIKREASHKHHCSEGWIKRRKELHQKHTTASVMHAAEVAWKRNAQKMWYAGNEAALKKTSRGNEAVLKKTSSEQNAKTQKQSQGEIACKRYNQDLVAQHALMEVLQKGVPFVPNEPRLSPEGQQQLMRVALVMKDAPHAIITIDSFSAIAGERGMALATARGLATKVALRHLGVHNVLRTTAFARSKFIGIKMKVSGTSAAQQPTGCNLSKNLLGKVITNEVGTKEKSHKAQLNEMHAKHLQMRNMAWETKQKEMKAKHLKVEIMRSAEVKYKNETKVIWHRAREFEVKKLKHNETAMEKHEKRLAGIAHSQYTAEAMKELHEKKLVGSAESKVKALKTEDEGALEHSNKAISKEGQGKKSQQEQRHKEVLSSNAKELKRKHLKNTTMTQAELAWKKESQTMWSMGKEVAEKTDDKQWDKLHHEEQEKVQKLWRQEQHKLAMANKTATEQLKAAELHWKVHAKHVWAAANEVKDKKWEKEQQVKHKRFAALATKKHSWKANATELSRKKDRLAAEVASCAAVMKKLNGTAHGPFTPLQIVSGTCASAGCQDVTTAADCEWAAKAVGWPAADNKVLIHSSSLPSNCVYMHGGPVSDHKIAFNSKKQSVPASPQRRVACLCTPDRKRAIQKWVSAESQRKVNAKQEGAQKVAAEKNAKVEEAKGKKQLKLATAKVKQAAEDASKKQEQAGKAAKKMASAKQEQAGKTAKKKEEQCSKAKAKKEQAEKANVTVKGKVSKEQRQKQRSHHQVGYVPAPQKRKWYVPPKELKFKNELWQKAEQTQKKKLKGIDKKLKSQTNTKAKAKAKGKATVNKEECDQKKNAATMKVRGEISEKTAARMKQDIAQTKAEHAEKAKEKASKDKSWHNSEGDAKINLKEKESKLAHARVTEQRNKKKSLELKTKTQKIKSEYQSSQMKLPSTKKSQPKTKTKVKKTNKLKEKSQSKTKTKNYLRASPPPPPGTPRPWDPTAS